MSAKDLSCSETAFKADLHTHSCFSDGSSSPAETIRAAAGRGLTAVALTDHDRIDGLAKAAAAAREMPNLSFIPGAEISTRHGNGACIHLLWYGVDYENTEVWAFFEQLRVQDDIRYRAIADTINADGFELDYDALKQKMIYVGGIAIIREMIAQAEKHATMRKTAALDRQQLTQIYTDAHREVTQAYPLISTAAANQVIKSFGGVSVIAHPLDKELQLSWDGLREVLSNIDIDGVEVFCIAHMQQNGITSKLLHYCTAPSRRPALLITGGSDNHDPPSTSRIGNICVSGMHLRAFLDHLEVKCHEEGVPKV